MVRTLAVSLFPAALLALGWLRLEEPRSGGADWLWVVLLALAPALAPRLWQRLALTAPAALVAAWVALDTPATDDRPGFFVPVADRFADGVADFYDVTVPFAGAAQPHMHGVIVLAIFGFCLVLAHAAAARRPLPALLAVIAGAGWPAALSPARSVLYGAAILAAALWVLAGLRVTRPVPALVAGAVIVLAAAGASTSAAVAKDGVLAWERWDPNGTSRQVSVSYVWDANYSGIEFPKNPTTVLRITGPKRGLYWRATTLDQFTDDRWIESLYSLGEGVAVGPLAPDPLLPRAAYDPRNWVKQQVEVVALADRRLVAATQARSLAARQLGRVEFLVGGVVRRGDPLARGQRYTVYSYAPNPQPKQLARLGPAYPGEVYRFLDVGRILLQPFGAAGRDARVDRLFGDERYLALWPYEALWKEAKRLRAGARTPYGAVVAIETWLRETGGFVYDESPPPTGGLPPLAHFVAEGKRGYCQQFAGAMALMLRFLGIPARVAAGFTSGTREDGGWTVTDRNAHAWVEVWFPGYGWLAFDPTPGRGELAGAYSASSTGFNPSDSLEAFGQRSVPGNLGGAAELGRLLELKERLAARGASGAGTDDRTPRAFWLLVLAAVAVVGAIGAAKLVRRRLRYVGRDPRRVAGAARRELVDFLADQGIPVGASATPDELRALVHHELGADARPFARALAQARFGPPAASEAAAARARRELRSLLRVLRRSFGRAARLRGLVSLRSLRA
ncbi:MAG: transglutaminase family protein [Gaiellaceae bacterium]